jgi:tetratricopeptide (TPR) repeat protein
MNNLTNELLTSAVTLHKQGNLNQAEALYLDLLTADPRNADALQYLGMLNAQKGQTDAAIAYLQQALAIAPQHFAALCNLGMMLTNLQHFEPALEQFDRALQVQPDSAQIWYSRGNVLLALQRSADACESYRRAVAIDPKLVEAHINLATILSALGQLDEAAASFRWALEIMPDFAEVHVNLAITLGALGQLDGAVESYRRALAIKPDFAEAHNNLGNALIDLEQFESAAASCRRALELNPGYVMAHINLGNVLRKLGRHDEAMASLRRALELAPHSAEAHYNLGILLVQAEQVKEAEACYRRALEIKPDFAQAHFTLGWLLADLGRLDEAITAYQHAYAADPGNRGLDAAVWAAVLYYLKSDIAQCQRLLIASQPIMTTTDYAHSAARTYREYMALLVPYWPQYDGPNTQPEKLERLHVIGDSHCLVPHGKTVTYRAREMRYSAELIMGCKQWHLGNAQGNKYKRKFEATMARLPGQSIIMITAGEIDCRSDEGIINAWKKSPTKSLADVAHATVTTYVAYVSRINAQYGHQLIICGVPAAKNAFDGLTAEVAEQLVNLIRIVNAILKKEALAAGMDFLDVYALTDGGNGIATGAWHLDTHHLLPNAVAEAFDKYCIHAE